MMIGVAAVPDAASPVAVLVTTSIAGDWSKLFAAALGPPAVALETTDLKAAPIADPASAASTDWLATVIDLTPAVATAPIAATPAEPPGAPVPVPNVPPELAADRSATDSIALSVPPPSATQQVAVHRLATDRPAFPVQAPRVAPDDDADGHVDDAGPALPPTGDAVPTAVSVVLLMQPVQNTCPADSADIVLVAAPRIPAAANATPPQLAAVPANSSAAISPVVAANSGAAKLPMVSARPSVATLPVVPGQAIRVLRPAAPGEPAAHADDVQPLPGSRRAAPVSDAPMTTLDAPDAKTDPVASTRSAPPPTGEPLRTPSPGLVAPPPAPGVDAVPIEVRVGAPMPSVAMPSSAPDLRAPAAVPATRLEAVVAPADALPTRRRGGAAGIETVAAPPVDRPAPAPAPIAPVATAPIPLPPTHDPAAAIPPPPHPATAPAGDGALDIATANLGSIGVIVDAVETRLAVRLSVEPGPAALLLAAAGDRLDASLSAVGQRLDTLTVDVRDGDARRPPPPPYTPPPPLLRRPTPPPRAVRDRYA